MKTFTKYPKSYIRAASNPIDFVIENGVLKKYVGPGGDVVIPDGVKRIIDYAFYKCSSLTSVTIPSSVTSIGDSAFYKCSSLTSITIPYSVTYIGESAFQDCSSLTSVTIPDSVTSIGNWAFQDCSSLTSITIPYSVTAIKNLTFWGCTSLTSVAIPDSVTYIGDYAFRSCTSLISVTIPESVTSIGDRAFYGCSSLTSVDMLGHPTIGQEAFNNTPVESQFSKKKKSTSKRKRTRKSFESIDEWYESEIGEKDGLKFAEELEQLVLAEFPGANYFEEPSAQGFAGADFVTLTVDGTTYEFRFDYGDQLERIFEEGPETAARYYLDQIIDNMDEEHIVEE